MTTKQAWNVNLLFLLLIFGLGLATALHPKRSFSERENRSLQRMPEVKAEDIFSGSFEQDYEDYLTDQFIFRDEWISLRTLAERAALRQDVHDVYFAKDHYLIEKHSDIFERPLALENARQLNEFAVRLSDEYDAQHLTVMVIPNAVKVMEDKLPLFAAPYDEGKYLSKISEGLPKGVWFDALSVLKEHNDEEIFYRTDHHWQTLGAYYVFKEWVKQKGFGEITRETYKVTTATDQFEGTIAAKVGGKVPKDSIQIYKSSKEPYYSLTYNRSDDVRHSIYQMSALETRDKYSFFFGGNYGLIEAKTTAHTGRKLLLVKDSYAHCFAPFLLDYFDEIDLVDLRYYSDSLSALMEEKQYTDVMILQNAAGLAEDTSLMKLTM